MPRTLPSKEYCGLTIVLSQQSRFDVDVSGLLTGWALIFFNRECLQNRVTTQHCDLRTSNTQFEGLLPNTKCLLLLGEKSFQEWTVGYSGYSLSEQRGYLLDNVYNLPCIASYSPIDCLDMIDHESRLNPLLREEEISREREEDDDDESSKRHGKTRRSNWKFWLQMDTCKILGILFNGIPKEPEPTYITYPNSSNIINYLHELNGEDLFFDIETDPPSFNISVFSVGHSLAAPIFIVPCLRFSSYSPAYSLLDMARIYRALGRAFSRNRVVIHNSCFDLFVCSFQYKLDFPFQIYDTMLAFHRCFPEAEKSLGHVMSWGTYQKYHKDEGIFKPRTTEQEQALWKYNGKDVYGLMLAKRAIEVYAENDKGLQASIEEANSRPRPYLVNTFTGIKFDEEARKKMIGENDRKMMQYLRIIKLLARYELLPSSNKQMVEYIHGKLGYKIVKVSKQTGKPSLDGDALYKLKLKHPDNPVIDFCIAYRERQTETSRSKWNPWYSCENNFRNTCGWKLLGARTLRLSSAKLMKSKEFPGWGTNLQNPSENQCKLYIAG